MRTESRKQRAVTAFTTPPYELSAMSYRLSSSAMSYPFLSAMSHKLRATSCLLIMKCRARHARHFCPTEEKKRSRPYEDKNTISTPAVLDASPTPARRLLSVISFSPSPLSPSPLSASPFSPSLFPLPVAEVQSNQSVSLIRLKPRLFS